MEEKKPVTNFTILQGEVIRKFDKRSEKAPTRFTIKTIEEFGDDKRSTNFHNVISFNDCDFKVGDIIKLKGNLRSGSYDRDGQKVYTYEVCANKIEMVAEGDVVPEDIPEGDINFDDVPF